MTRAHIASPATPEPPAPSDGAGPGAQAFASLRTLSRGELVAAPVRWPRPSRLSAALELPAGRTADGLATLGLRTVGELLEHLPSDSREARSVAALQPGEQATVAVQVRVISARAVRRRGMRPLVQATVFDATGAMRATFFNQPWLVDRYTPGTRLLLHGKADGKGGFRVSHHAVASGSAPEPAGGLPGIGSPPPRGARGEAADAPALALGGSAGAPSAMAEPQERGAVAHYPAAEGVTSTQILTL